MNKTLSAFKQRVKHPLLLEIKKRMRNQQFFPKLSTYRMNKKTSRESVTHHRFQYMVRLSLCSLILNKMSNQLRSRSKSLDNRHNKFKDPRPLCKALRCNLLQRHETDKKLVT